MNKKKLCKQYKDMVWNFAVLFPDEIGIPHINDGTRLNAEEWWGTVSDCLARARALRSPCTHGRTDPSKPCPVCPPGTLFSEGVEIGKFVKIDAP